MLTKPDQQQLAALAQICRAPEGVRFLGLLETELKRHHEMLLETSGDNTARTQGAAKKLTEIIQLIRQAPELLEKVRKP